MLMNDSNDNYNYDDENDDDDVIVLRVGDVRPSDLRPPLLQDPQRLRDHE
jgi:hypothetical protein